MALKGFTEEAARFEEIDRIASRHVDDSRYQCDCCHESGFSRLRIVGLGPDFRRQYCPTCFESMLSNHGICQYRRKNEGHA